MTYRYTSIDGREILPTGLTESDISTAPTVDTTIKLPNGRFYDAGGEQAGPALPYDLTLQGKLLDDPEVYQEPPGGYALATKWQYLRELRGHEVKLYREVDDGSEQWAWARLMHVGNVRTPRQYGYLSVKLLFKMLSLWHGTYHDDTITLTNAQTNVFLVSTGNAVVSDITLTVTAGATPITKVEFRNWSIEDTSEIEWTGSLQSEALTIYCGDPRQQRRILQGTADAYSGFAFGDEHNHEDWLRFRKVNQLRITRTGGSATDTCRVQWYELWE